MDEPPTYSYLLQNILLTDISVLLQPNVLLSFIVLIALLFAAALISAGEVAFFSLEPAHIEQIKRSRSRKDDKVLDLLKNPKKLIATFLIAINFVNIGIVILSSVLLENEELFSFPNETIRFVVQVVIVTFLILIIGEVAPKIYASRNPVKLAVFMAYPIGALQTAFTPVSLLLLGSTFFIEKVVKRKGHEVSVDELSHALDLTDSAIKTPHEKKILKGIVKFGNTDVKQIMTPRVDVLAFEKEEKFSELIPKISESGFSRIPVYSESLDNVMGILYIKDLIKNIEKGDEFEWTSLCRPAFFVPENKKIDDLLKEFQTKKIHVAVVVDEYGGCSGIITLEDIIEEIVGDINDEFDDEELIYSKLDERNFIFEGKTPLTDLYRILEIEGKEFEEAKGESDTLAGFILEKSGRIPKKMERISFNNYLFTIESADKRRVKRVKVTVQPLEKEEAHEE